ncbi:pentapeptide repeat-containing protein [Dactylosporangium aurantiacum]|uniref:pentapeptide repeat-containing protein n=1 Tax=Dactylosporangium aurantiacum TaxID=35754 RepID=UPI0036C9EB1B
MALLACLSLRRRGGATARCGAAGTVRRHRPGAALQPGAASEPGAALQPGPRRAGGGAGRRRRRWSHRRAGRAAGDGCDSGVHPALVCPRRAGLPAPRWSARAALVCPRRAGLPAPRRAGPRRAGPRRAGPRRAGPRRAGPRRAGLPRLASRRLVGVVSSRGAVSFVSLSFVPRRPGSPCAVPSCAASCHAAPPLVSHRPASPWVVRAVLCCGLVSRRPDPLRRARLRRARLCRARLCRARLCRARLCRARLCRARLRRGRLCRARLRRDRLCRARLCRARLRRALARHPSGRVAP